MPELNTNGLPGWAARLLEQNPKTVERCRDNLTTYRLLITSLDGYVGPPLVRADLSSTLNGALEISAVFQDKFGIIERRYVECDGGWRAANSSSVNLPEIQMDSGIPMGDVYMIGKDPASSAVIKNVGPPDIDWSQYGTQDGKKRLLDAMFGKVDAEAAKETLWREKQAARTREEAKQQYLQRTAWQEATNALVNPQGAANTFGNSGWLQGAANRAFQGVPSDPFDDRRIALEFALQSAQNAVTKKSPPKPPDPPEPRSKNGRMIRLKDLDDED